MYRILVEDDGYGIRNMVTLYFVSPNRAKSDKNGDLVKYRRNSNDTRTITQLLRDVLLNFITYPSFFSRLFFIIFRFFSLEMPLYLNQLTASLTSDRSLFRT